MIIHDVYRKQTLDYDFQWRQAERINDVDDIPDEGDELLRPERVCDGRDTRGDGDLRRGVNFVDCDIDYDGFDGECER